MLLDSITGPADLRTLTQEQLDQLAGEIRALIVERWRRRATATSARTSAPSSSPSPCTGCSTRPATSSCGTPATRPTSTRSSPAAPATSTTCARRRPVGLPVAGPSPSTTGSRTATPRRSSATPTAWPSPRSPSGGEGRRVVAVIGDGSMTGGMAFEGLNNLGHSGKQGDHRPQRQRPLLRPHRLEARARAWPASALNPSYLRNRARLDRILHEVPVVGDQLEKSLDGFVAAMREMFEPPAFFETSACATRARSTATTSRAREGAAQRRRVRRPDRRARRSPRRAGATRPPRTTRSSACTTSAGLKPGSYTAAFTEAMIKEAEDRPELVAITAAMPDSTGLLPFGERFPGRLIDVGIAEQHAVTVRRRHGDGRAAPGRRRLLHVPHPGHRPGQLRRRPARPARRVLPRPRRHHRRRRRRRTTACSTWCCSPRCRA